MRFIIKNNNYKTGVSNDIENVIKNGRRPLKWDFLFKYCLKMDKSIKILDIGCGTGNKMLFLLKRGFKNIIGLEYNKDVFLPMVKKHPELNIIEGNAERLNSFKTECFDLVYCHHVLEHLPNPESAIKEANRVLKREGIYIIGIPNGNHLNDKAIRFAQLLVYRNYDHLQKLNLQKISNLLQKNGFKILEIKTIYNSLTFLLDDRIIHKHVLGFFLKYLYRICKLIYWKAIGFEISAIKEEI